MCKLGYADPSRCILPLGPQPAWHANSQAVLCQDKMNLAEQYNNAVTPEEIKFEALGYGRKGVIQRVGSKPRQFGGSVEANEATAC